MVIVAVIMMLVLGAVLGLGLGVADKYLKVEADVRVEKVTSLLPGYNCGGCGFPCLLYTSCPRCWNYTESDNEDGLCDRCNHVLHD